MLGLVAWVDSGHPSVLQTSGDNLGIDVTSTGEEECQDAEFRGRGWITRADCGVATISSPSGSALMWARYYPYPSTRVRWVLEYRYPGGMVDARREGPCWITKRTIAPAIPDLDNPDTSLYRTKL